MTHNKNKLPICSNCSYKFGTSDNFCPECGQENHNNRLPAKHLFHEVVEGIFHLDSKSYTTFGSLLFKPGKLSKEFNAGKRASYVPPVRLYIFSSFLFFFLFLSGKIIHSDEAETKESEFKMEFMTGESRLTDQEKISLSPSQQDSLQKFRTSVSSVELAGMNNKQIEALMAEKKITPNWINRFAFGQMAKVGTQGSAEFYHLMFKNISYGMFLLMPFIGMFFYLFYRKQSGYYIDNLILSIHYHSAIFIIFSILSLAGKFFTLGMLNLLPVIIIPAYLFIMLKNYSGQGIIMTCIKTISIVLIQFTTTVLFYFIIMIISLALV